MTYLSMEVIFSKVFCILFDDVNTCAEGMYNLRYKFWVMLSISLGRGIICYIIKKKNITIEISDNLSKEDKFSIIFVSVIGCAIMYFNTIEMTLFISSFPYEIFLLDIVSLLLYFYISMKNILKTNKMEKQNLEIQNLELYNKTLTIMYDNIRGFKHDFSNFVQALDGYAKTNNIEGIKNMSKSILKDCINTNNMGILDPKIINNPAVYSIITNKYYLAQKEKINMNIEVMINLEDTDIGSYEFCRIFAILLYNAIEAAKECEEKIVNVRFVKDQKVNRKLVIIENSYNTFDVDIEKIFEKGYSTKKEIKEEHGLGLWNVRKILNQTNNLSLFTSKGELFSQQLEIYQN